MSADMHAETARASVLVRGAAQNPLLYVCLDRSCGDKTRVRRAVLLVPTVRTTRTAYQVPNA